MFINFIQGFMMALADSVPGVSGGTIAFLMGFYDKFINSLNYLIKGTKQERTDAIKFLAKLGIGWVVGMALAVSILASVFDSGIYKVSSLFLGFIMGAIPLIIIEEKKALKENYKNILFAFIGIALIVVLSIMKFSANISVSHLTFGNILYIIVAGMLAISAMVLPGISGSTILLSFGLYIPIITALKDLLHLNFNGFFLLLVFGIGVILGVLVSLRGIKNMLLKHRSKIVYAIIGMMIGSLYAIVVGPTTLEVPREPMSFNEFYIGYFIIGVIFVLGLEKLKQLPWYKKVC